MIHIYTLSSKDIEQFYPTYKYILQTEFPGYSPEVIDFLLNRMYSPLNLRTWVQQGEKIIVVAKVEETIVGFAIIDALYGGVSFCRWLGVLPTYQHQGIGTQIIAEWEKIANVQHAHKMEVAGQPTAKEFYIKMGLNMEGFRKASYFGIDQYLFGKILAEPNSENMTK